MESGILRVSDPCYYFDVWCSGQLENARKGKWKAVIEKLSPEQTKWGERVASLLVFHAGAADVPFSFASWKEAPFEVGVDSGQAGVFDLAYYRNDAVVKENDYGSYPWDCDGPFYSACGSHTLSEKQAGCLSHGAVSSSGYGDGGYRAYYAEEGGEVVAVRIVFIDEDEGEKESA